MEYRLNKIDTDLRQKINDAAKEGKVHGAKGIAISKDKPKEQKQKGKETYKSQSYDKNKKLLVDATKAENIEVEAYKEDKDIKNASLGAFIDTKI